MPPAIENAKHDGARRRLLDHGTTLTASVPVIGVSGKDALGAEKLLGQQAAYQHMGPGQTAQGENRVGGLPHRLREPVGAADEKGHVRDAVVLPAPEPFGERAAGQLLAVLVESSDDRRVGYECVSTCRSRWSPYH